MYVMAVSIFRGMRGGNPVAFRRMSWGRPPSAPPEAHDREYVPRLGLDVRQEGVSGEVRRHLFPDIRQLGVEYRRPRMADDALVGLVLLVFKHMYLGGDDAARCTVEAYNQIDALLPLLCLVAAEGEMVCGHGFQVLSI